jgi:hypothetical protein
MGEMTPEMDETVKPFIAGQQVWDLGAGSLDYAKHLLCLGAREVFAVDKEGFHPTRYQGRNITPIERYFADVKVPPGGLAVAWVSWPTNHVLHGLLPLLSAAEVVIYLGSNTGGSACGWPALYDHFHFREVLAHVPHRRNTLAVYGRQLCEAERRPLIGEEVAALTGQMMDFEHSEALARKVARLVEEDCGV